MWAINQSSPSTKHLRESPTLFLKISGLQMAVQGQLKLIRVAAEKNQCKDFELSANKNEIDISRGANRESETKPNVDGKTPNGPLLERRRCRTYISSGEHDRGNTSDHL